MSGFSVDWLDLREPADKAARDGTLAAAAAAIVAAAAGRIIDLGSGTGSTVRALAPHLAGPADWLLVDHDEALLAEAKSRATAGGHRIETLAADLANLEPLPFDGASLVTASALFDLVSEAFVERLADAAKAASVPVYAALTFDGRMQFYPPHRLDSQAMAAFNRDQRRDKGFGPALGGDGAPRLAEALKARGYKVRIEASPWRLRPTLPDLLASLGGSLIEGIAPVARPVLGPPLTEEWLTFRRQHYRTGQIDVGHLDILAVP